MIGPSFALLLKLPKIDDLLNRLSTDENNTKHETRKLAAESQTATVKILSLILTVSVFAALVPVLVVILPLSIYLMLCQRNCLDTKSHRQVGEVIASNILVQLPISSFRVLARGGAWAVAVFLIVDLDWGTGPLVFYSTFAIGEFAVSLLRDYRWKSKSSKGPQSYRDVPFAVSFEMDTNDDRDAPSQIEFHSTTRNSLHHHSRETVQFKAPTKGGSFIRRN